MLVFLKQKTSTDYLNDFTTMNLRETNPNDPALQNVDITIFKYAGDKELMKDFFTTVIKLALSNSKMLLGYHPDDE